MFLKVELKVELWKFDFNLIHGSDILLRIFQTQLMRHDQKLNNRNYARASKMSVKLFLRFTRKPISKFSQFFRQNDSVYFAFVYIPFRFPEIFFEN